MSAVRAAGVEGAAEPLRVLGLRPPAGDGARVAEGKGVVSADAERMTLSEYLDRWLNTAKPTVAQSSWESYVRRVRLHFKPRVGGIRLAAHSPLLVEKMFASMSADGITNGNAKKVSEVFSSALEHAVRQGMTRGNPASSARKPKVEDQEVHPFSPAEAKAILRASEPRRLHALCSLAVGTGMRQGELLALEWPDFDLQARTVTVRKSLAQVKGKLRVKEPKSKRGRRVVALKKHRARMKGEGLLVSPSFCTKGVTHIHKSSYGRQVHRPTLAAAGVPYRKFHAFRHTHVSELLSQGVNVVDVARRVGDRPEVILKVDAHFIPGGERSIPDKLDALSG